jgi:hypothetical protein
MKLERQIWTRPADHHTGQRLLKIRNKRPYRRPHFDHTFIVSQISCTSGGNHRSLLRQITDSAFKEGEHAA